MKRMFTFLIVLPVAFIQAQTYYGNGYTIVTAEQVKKKDDLQATVYKSITAKTVKGGLQQLLRGSGWQLAKLKASDPNIKRLYKQRYPDFKRNIDPTSLEQALGYIVGDSWELVVDPINKLVSFQLSSKYQCFSKAKLCLEG